MLKRKRVKRAFCRIVGCAGKRFLRPSSPPRSHLCFALAPLPAHPKFRALKTPRKRLLRRLGNTDQSAVWVDERQNFNLENYVLYRCMAFLQFTLIHKESECRSKEIVPKRDSSLKKKKGELCPNLIELRFQKISDKFLFKIFFFLCSNCPRFSAVLMQLHFY